MLVGFALVGFADHIVAQAQHDVVHHRHRVGQGFDAGGVHRAHGFDDAEKAVELGQQAVTFGRLEFQAGQIGDAVEFREGQGHVLNGVANGQ